MKPDDDRGVPHDLLQFIESSTAEMAREYERIRARAGEDPGTAGDEGEENWADLLRAWLPERYHVRTKGRLIATDGSRSPQLDVVVLSPTYPKGLLSKNKKTYLAAGVMAAFECKTTLRPTDIDKTFKTAVTLGKLSRRDSRGVDEPIYGLLAHSHDLGREPGRAASRITELVWKADHAHILTPLDRLDVLCVADVGTWSYARFAYQVPDGSEPPRLSTTYMGGTATNYRPDGTPIAPNPVGRFLTTLLRRLSSQDFALHPIARYFEVSGVPGGGGIGLDRQWPVDHIHPALWKPIF